MVLFDLDRFKEINDRMGHAVGDRVLQTFAATTTTTLGTDVLFGRIGGEEFAAFMPVGDLGEAPTVSVGLTVAVLAETGSAATGQIADAKLTDLKQRVDTLLMLRTGRSTVRKQTDAIAWRLRRRLKRRERRLRAPLQLSH
jgi:GGDEF domain-containing protein